MTPVFVIIFLAAVIATIDDERRSASVESGPNFPGKTVTSGNRQCM
jgi:hypothetical protein